jgi:hypothetical protein
MLLVLFDLQLEVCLKLVIDLEIGLLFSSSAEERFRVDGVFPTLLFFRILEKLVECHATLLIWFGLFSGMASCGDVHGFQLSVLNLRGPLGFVLVKAELGLLSWFPTLVNHIR